MSAFPLGMDNEKNRRHPDGLDLLVSAIWCLKKYNLETNTMQLFCTCYTIEHLCGYMDRSEKIERPRRAVCRAISVKQSPAVGLIHGPSNK